jgi:uncharacterized phage protein (TIGR02220 family)
VSSLDTDKKLFYIYLLTNERTKQCGVYEITVRQMSFDTGFSIDKINKLIKYFIVTGKIKYNTKTSELGVGNWLKYNNSTSPKVQSCINKEFESVKDRVLIEYVKSIGTLSQEEQEEEQEEILHVESIDFDQLLKFINKVGKRNFKTINDKAKRQYKARLKEGYTKEIIQTAVINAYKNEHHINNGCKWLTPEFFSRPDKLDLYGTKEQTNIPIEVLKACIEVPAMMDEMTKKYNLSTNQIKSLYASKR